MSPHNVPNHIPAAEAEISGNITRGKGTRAPKCKATGTHLPVGNRTHTPPSKCSSHQPTTGTEQPPRPPKKNREPRNCMAHRRDEQGDSRKEGHASGYQTHASRYPKRHKFDPPPTLAERATPLPEWSDACPSP